MDPGKMLLDTVQEVFLTFARLAVTLWALSLELLWLDVFFAFPIALVCRAYSISTQT